MNTRISSLLLFIFITLIQACSQKETVVEEKREFDEQFRPQYHFSPPANWMNDPNGMVYFEGEYHLFYQHYPDGNVWGPMHWGHAISADLIHWEHLPIAIYPDELGWIFSGSAVVDWENTSGLGTGNQPPMIAIYTYHLDSGEKAGRDDYQTQGIAYSNDKGRTWTKYENNPVLSNPGIKDFRDPKVTWQEESESWIMSLAVKDKISFYTSSNLLEWTYQSDFNPEWAAYGGVWECPDLFPLTTETGQEKWVLLVSINPGGPNGGSATQYFVGDFDGKAFTTETTEVKWLDYGTDNYAGVTWSDVPKEDGRRLFLGWMSNWLYANEVPTEVWRSAMTVPRTLELLVKDDDFSIASRPVVELEKLRSSTKEQEGKLINLESDLLEIELESLGSDFELLFSNDQGDQLLISKIGDDIFFDRTQSGLIDFSAQFPAIHQIPLLGIQVGDIRIFLDRSSIEIFINDGESVITELIFPTAAYSSLQTEGIDQTVTIHQLKSIWGK